MKRSFFLVIVTSLSLFRVAGTSAEASNWAVVPAANGEMSPSLKRAVAEVRRELERQGKHVQPSPVAGSHSGDERLTTGGTLTNDELKRWKEHSRAAVEELAKGNHAMALEHLERAKQLTRSAIEELNREPLRAQRVLDTCLYMVRALLETNDAVGARAHVAECVLLVPRGEPATLMHPPLVSALYERTRNAGRRNAASLLVESAPSGCGVRINGVLFGETPLETNELSKGDYAVQVECDGTRRGRIHPAKVGSETTKIFVDTPSDRTQPARVVVLISLPSADMIELDLVTRTGIRQGCARVAATARGPSAKALSLAVRNLIDGKCQDL